MLRPVLALATSACLIALPAVAGPLDIPELPEGWDMPTAAIPDDGLPAPELTAEEIAGAWRYTTANHAIVACDFPVWPLEPAAGDMEIAPHDGSVAVTLVTGAVCDPASMCLYEGILEGGALTVANRDTVDSEGGVAANGWTVAFASGTSASGSGTSVYVHPEGAQCLWSYTVTLDR